MLRALLALLLLANLLFFGWAGGWLAPAFPAPGAADREPGRVAAQVAPERVTVLAPAAASAALAAAARKALCPPAGVPGAASAAQPAMPDRPATPTVPAVPAVPALPSANQAAALNPCEPGP